MNRARISLVVLLALAGGAIAGLLLYEHHGVRAATEAVDQLCGADSASGCEAVSQSSYSSVGGLSLAAVGVSFYASAALLGALALVSAEPVRQAAGALWFVAFAAALAVDAGLLGIQAFAIGAYCSLCLATYAVNALIFLVVWPAVRSLGSIFTFLFGGEGFRMFMVWALGSLVLLVSVTSVDRALATVESEPLALLGGSAVEAAPPRGGGSEAEAPEEPQEASPVTAARQTVEAADQRLSALEQELDAANAKLRELQETLDDPEKYAAYQEAAAQEAFENAPVEELAVDGIPFKGPEGAPITVVEYSDFLCPFCRNLAGAFANYLPQSEGRIKIVFKNYPLDKDCNESLSRTVHEGACELALGAICAHEQGKFWEYHDRVFQAPPVAPTASDVAGLASAAGLDAMALGACMSTEAAKNKLAEQIAEARRLQVNSTPTIYVNGKKLPQVGMFLAAIETEAERLGLQ